MRLLAAKLDMSGRIGFLGDQKDVSAIHSQAQIYLLITNWEGFPESILEAMRAGLPVIASDVGGNSEAVTDGLNGHIGPPKDSARLSENCACYSRSPNASLSLETLQSDTKRSISLLKRWQPGEACQVQVQTESCPYSLGKRYPARHSIGFSLVELLVCLLVLASLIAILIPNFVSLLNKGKSLRCQANLRQISSAVFLYASDNDGWLPVHYDGPAAKWWHVTEVAPYLGHAETGNLYLNSKLFCCPSDDLFRKRTFQSVPIQEISYGYNVQMGQGGPLGMERRVKLAAIVDPSKKLLLGDSGHFEEDGEVAYMLNRSPDRSQYPYPRHEGRANVAWADGHVSQIVPQDWDDHSRGWFPMR